MGASFQNVRIIPHFEQGATGGFDVHWAITGVSGAVTFQVLVADNPDGPWSPCLEQPTNQLFALNVGRILLNQQELQYFKVQIFSGSLLLATSQSVTPRSQLDRREYLVYREMLRRVHLDFEKTPGSNPGYLLVRRIFGDKCQVCCDELLGTPVSNECSVCYGTGIIGGYYPAYEMWADWASEAPAFSDTETEQPGPIQEQQAQADIFPYPTAHSQDIWVDRGTGYRYRILRVGHETFEGAPISQNLAMIRLPAQHPAYSFPLPAEYDSTGNPTDLP